VKARYFLRPKADQDLDQHAYYLAKEANARNLLTLLRD